MSVRLTVVTANIGRGVKQDEARDNIVRVRHGFGTAPLVGWQEIDEADEANEHAILGRIFGPGTYDNVGFRQAVPISVPQPWTVIDADVTKACDFIPGATPNRYIVSAVIEHPDLPAPIVAMNGHYNLPRLGGKLGPKHWRECQAAWEAKVLEWHREGLDIVTTRDSNRLRRMPPLHRMEKQLLPNAIVRISLIPSPKSPLRIKAGPQQVVNLTIDRHEAKGVELTITAR